MGVAAYDDVTETIGKNRGLPKGNTKGKGRGKTGRGRNTNTSSRSTSSSTASTVRQSSSSSQMAKRRLGDTGVVRGGPHHGPWKTTAEIKCFLCDKVGHLAKECQKYTSSGNAEPRKRAFEAFVGSLYDADQNSDYSAQSIGGDFVPSNMHDYPGYGILDGGATRTVGGPLAVHEVVDRTVAKLQIETVEQHFNFAGGDTAASSHRLWCPIADDVEMGIHTVGNHHTPILAGLDFLKEYQVILNYHDNTAYGVALGAIKA